MSHDLGHDHAVLQLSEFPAGFDLSGAFETDGQGYYVAPAQAFNWGVPLFEKDERASSSCRPARRPRADVLAPTALPAPSLNSFPLSFAPQPFTFDQPPAPYHIPALGLGLSLPGLPPLPPPSATDSPYENFTDFFNFDDAGDEDCPGLEPDFGDDDLATALLFPPAVAPAATPSEEDKSTSAATKSAKPKPRVRGPSTRATGFRGAATKLVPLDAPIQSRNYHVPSATSKKRKTTAVERALLKRQCGTSAPPVETPGSAADEEPILDDDAEEIPDDLLAAAERKRLCNTLAARKSRARKQGRLAQLEGENKTLVEENERLKRRVDELELMLRGVQLDA